MTVFALFFVIALLMLVGLAIDTSRTEFARVRLQSTLDRAALAAADLEQTLDPQTVVDSYFAAAGLEGFVDEVTVDPGSDTSFRSVSVTASGAVPASFLKLAGVDNFPALAAGVAQESRPNVEISLVVDISSSMSSHSRIQNLRIAARDFACTLLPGTAADAAAARNRGITGPCAGEAAAGDAVTSINLVPYSASVALPPEMYTEYTINELHDLSRCVTFDDEDFRTTAIDPNVAIDQYPHFTPWDSEYVWRNQRLGVTHPNCQHAASAIGASREISPIVPASTTRAEILAEIEQLNTLGGTALDAGMKWGIALLDPSTKPVFDELIRTSHVDGLVSGRPVPFRTAGTSKVAVLMTDGDGDGQRNVHPALRGAMGAREALSNVWFDRRTGRYSVLLRGRYLRQYPYDRMNSSSHWDNRDWWGCGEPLDDHHPSDWNRRSGVFATERVNIDDDAWFAGKEASGELVADGIVRHVAYDENDRCHPVWYHVNTSSRPNWYYNWHDGSLRDHPYSRHRWTDDRNNWDVLNRDLERLTWAEVFDHFSYIDAEELLYDQPSWWGWLSDEEREVYTDVRADDTDRNGHATRLREICTTAKAQGVVIYTVAFEMDRISNSSRRTLARQIMTDCATSPSHAFDVNAGGLTGAFQSIARQISELRLTQ